MHASRLVELAAAVASFHRPLIEQDVAAEFWSAEHFWVLSRARVNEWSRLMKQCQRTRNESSDRFQPHMFWKATAPLIEEILLSEVCTRLWCATLTIIDEQRLHGELAPIARSVFVTNLEVRRRALRLLLFARGLQGIETTPINRLRHHCESWTDTLLSQLSMTRLAQQFGYDKRAIQQRVNQQRGKSARMNSIRKSIDQVGLRYGLAARKPFQNVCPELNSEIATGILACLPPTGFDGCGSPSLSWSVDGFQSDMLSINILEDLCGNSPRPRYDVLGSLKDRH